ncbi:MDR family MFS transporter [Gordonibacter urolithinfaciens]|uniref:DHA2 family efflux MFS transporter permease subunit n=1 Tax=Gordonibacter urolithinfaciens TaxID=1335613 RepID=A0A6N8IFA6_9ACTN|nr:MDR family MFS transporter [Gordonibacter urolithinfaciens]MVM54249.1 DHA2 family efflux MFS transporter permease subunit [Gordonibacter urolithinfaciens]MVN14505.1 DHA2 family efflux MFS transporter permease subunit [Gordonibacter urolithinfaciens]MVN37704.1 DHA2 family efflux MFS transporter permease subunit [Gordonibacter urolithinfaciens]MVN56300.1 DHA2 family efflux MFS transporter permease subunit [Gordonibacter urolithinfaciens]MVN61582.1 DHA2 family efflux MFS transporter permease s
MGLSRKQIIMLAVLVFGTFVTVLNQTVVAPALPSVMAEMSVDASTAQWLTTGFTLVNAIMIPITAFLTDRFTTKRLFLVSMAIFTAGSALAGWGPSFAVLLLGRLVQAAGAGILMPLVMTMLMWTFPVDKRGTAMGLFGIVIAFGPAIGPTVAGVIIDRYTWHDMFYIITVLSAVVVLIGAFVLEKGGETNKDVSLDVPSVVLSSFGFGGLLYGLSTIGSYGLRADAIAGTLVGVVALVFFFRRQLKMEHPMLQVRVLANRKFLIATIIGMLVQGALLAAGILVPIYLQSLMGYSATVSGLVLLPGAIIMGAMGPIAGRLFDKHGPRVLALVGMGVLTLTTFCFAFLGTETGLITLTVLYTVRLFSLSLVNMPITTWGMNALDNELVNHGTSVNNTFRQVAGSLGTAIIVSASTIATNASARVMTPTQASIFGIDVAFALAGVLCLIGFVMVVALVKNKPGETAELDKDNARRTVLESIMKRDVFTLPSNATVAEAMKLLVDKHISAAPLVNAEGKAVGFVSDGDIMRYLSKRSTMMMDPVVMIMQTVDADGGNKDFARKLDELMGMQALSIGAKGIIGVDVHADLPEVCRVLGENHLKKVPVLDDGQVVGVINRSDITHYSMEQYLAERGDEALAAGSGEGQGPTKLERAEEAAALPDDEAVASSI